MAYDLNDQMNVALETFTADKVFVYVQAALSKDYPGLASSIQFKKFLSMHVDQMILQLTAWMVSGQIPVSTTTKTVRWPDGSWQMFKETHLPVWFKRLFPVRWHTEEFTVQTNHYFVCPHLATDPQRKHIQFMAIGTPLAARMAPNDRF